MLYFLNKYSFYNIIIKKSGFFNKLSTAFIKKSKKMC